MNKKFLKIPAIIVFSGLLSLNYSFFIFPNNFLPAGIDGICTIIQDLTGINIGYLSFAINIPLLITAYRFLNKEFSVNTTIFVIVFSLTSIMWKALNISDFGYVTDNGTSTILAPVVAGVIRGLLYVVTLRINCCGGGIDIVASVVKKNKPHLELMYIIFAANTMISICAFFVYGMKIEPVVCSIIYFFTTSLVSNSIRASQSEVVRLEIITPNAESLCNEIIEKFHQPATVIDAHGAYSGMNNKVVICVTDKVSAPKIEKAILAHSDAVTFKSTVSNSGKLPDYL